MNRFVRIPASNRGYRAPRVLVLGGAGFIGRHAVAALLDRGVSVIVASRHPKRIGHRLPTAARGCERRKARLESLLTANAWTSLLADIDVVVNCVGILRQRGRETFERVHHLAPAALAKACRVRGIRLVHVSALGLDHSVRSRFLTSKHSGEIAVSKSGADWHLVRPSLVDGENGFGARWIRRVANWRLHVLPANAVGRIAPLDVRDLGEALAVLATGRCAKNASAKNRIYELGGGELRTMTDHLSAMRLRPAAERPLVWRLPSVLARIASHVCDVLHVTPYSFGHYELLLRDNAPRVNRLPELLGRLPRPVGVTVRAQLRDSPLALAGIHSKY